MTDQSAPLSISINDYLRVRKLSATELLKHQFFRDEAREISQAYTKSAISDSEIVTILTSMIAKHGE